MWIQSNSTTEPQPSGAYTGFLPALPLVNGRKSYPRGHGGKTGEKEDIPPKIDRDRRSGANRHTLLVFKILQTGQIEQNTPKRPESKGQKNIPRPSDDARETIISSAMLDHPQGEAAPVLQAWSQPSAAARPCILDAVKCVLFPPVPG